MYAPSLYMLLVVPIGVKVYILIGFLHTAKPQAEHPGPSTSRPEPPERQGWIDLQSPEWWVLNDEIQKMVC